MSFSSRPIRSGEESSFSRKKIAGYMLIAGAAIGRSIRKAHARIQSYRQLHDTESVDDEGLPQASRSIIRKAVTICIALCAIAVLVLGSVRALAFVNILSPLGFISVATTPLKQDEHGFTNILLLGMGDKSHPGADLTDTMQVASIDAKTKSVVMLSLPRDLYMMKTDSMGTGRINGLFRNERAHLVAQGVPEKEATQQAMNELKKEVGSLINLDIQYIALLNFSGFEQAIDAIGGIDVDVPEDIADYEYPARDNSSYDPFFITKGPRHLDGATALKYARSRHSTSDFSRSARQQQIISAVVTKLKADGFIKNISNISKLYSIISSNFNSTMTIGEIISLARTDTSHIVSFQISDNTAQAGGFLYPPPREQFEGASILLPIANSQKTAFGPLKSFGQLIFTKREWFLTPPRIAILNAGAKSGSAHLLEAALVQYGFDIVHTGNYDDNPKTKIDTSFITFQQDKDIELSQRHIQEIRSDVAQFLADSLSIGKPKVAVSNQLTGSPDIVIVTGKNYSYKPFYDLIERTLPPVSSSSSISAQ